MMFDFQRKDRPWAQVGSLDYKGPNRKFFGYDKDDRERGASAWCFAAEAGWRGKGPARSDRERWLFRFAIRDVTRRKKTGRRSGGTRGDAVSGRFGERTVFARRHARFS